MAARQRSRSGWVTLSAVLIVLAGCYNIIWGSGALGKKDLFREDSLIYSNLSFWGWIFLIIGILQIVTAILLFMRHALGVALAAIGATTSAFFAFMSLLSNPAWSLTILALDIFILWSLFAHYEDFE